MIVLSDTGFHATDGDPANLTLCQSGEWQDRLLVETVLSMLTLVCHFKKGMHRAWAYFQARLTCTMAAFNVLVQWHGFQPYASGFVPVWSKNSCGLAHVVFQESPEPVPLALMIPLVMKMRHILRQRMVK